MYQLIISFFVASEAYAAVLALVVVPSYQEMKRRGRNWRKPEMCGHCQNEARLVAIRQAPALPSASLFFPRPLRQSLLAVEFIIDVDEVCSRVESFAIVVQ